MYDVRLVNMFNAAMKHATSNMSEQLLTRSSADADNGLDAFVGQSRSTNISGPFQVK